MMFALMIKFTGISEKDWSKTEGHKVKELLKRLKNHEQNNPKFTCPFLKGKK